MKKIISLKCPKCGANLSLEEGRSQYFCSYCGTKFIVDDGIERKEEVYHININANTVYKDEAKVIKATNEGDLARRKYDDEVAEKNRILADKETQRKRKIHIGIFMIIVAVIISLPSMLFKPADGNHIFYELGCIGLVGGLWGGIFLISGLFPDGL